MKKIYKYISAPLLLSVLMLSACGGTQSETVESDSKAQSTSSFQSAESDMQNEYIDRDPSAMYENADVLMIRYVSEADGLSFKEIQDKNDGGEIKALLGSLTSSSKQSPKISDSPFSFDPLEKCYADIGTYWIRIDGNTIYRISADLSEISRCDDYYSEGEILNSGIDTSQHIYAYWEFYPYNTHFGTYENGSLTLHRVFSDKSDVEMTVKNMDDSSLTFEIASKNANRDISFDAVSEQNGNHSLIKSGTLSLTSGNAEQVTVSLPKSDKTYILSVITDGARINIEVKK